MTFSQLAQRFAAGTIVAMIALLSLIILFQHTTPAVYTTTNPGREILVSPDAHLDYRHGGWYADDVRLPLVCPEEDSCQLQVTVGGTWVFHH